LVGSSFDICVAVFVRASFHREQAAAMQRFEIAKRKFVTRLAGNFLTTVDPKMPFTVFFKSPKPDEFIFLRRRRFVLLPSAFFVGNHTTFAD
jgi:hypothetical protein